MQANRSFCCWDSLTTGGTFFLVSDCFTFRSMFFDASKFTLKQDPLCSARYSSSKGQKKPNASQLVLSLLIDPDVGLNVFGFDGQGFWNQKSFGEWTWTVVRVLILSGDFVWVFLEDFKV